MRLFDNITRTYDKPALYSESDFNYLNRSARPEVERVREVLEDWFSHYPPNDGVELRGRFRSSADSHHQSAFFELFLHELLLRLGCTIDSHPDLDNNSSRRPDFIVESPEGDRFYLEAVLATDKSKDDVATKARMNSFYDAIDRMESSNFWIGMNIEGAPQTPPPVRKVKESLSKQLSYLDPDKIGEMFNSGGFEAIPQWDYEHDGLKIEFYPIAKSPKSRGKMGHRFIGMQSYGFRKAESGKALRNAIFKKAGRYGELNLPYVVAVNTLGEFGTRNIDIMEALFGTEQITVDFGPTHPKEPVMTRILDGVWTSYDGPRYTRVSAVLLLNPVRASYLPNAPVRLYHNPWAAKPYESALCRLPQAAPSSDGRMIKEDGESLAQILDLSPDWPHS